MKKHVLIVGDVEVLKDYLDFDEYFYSLITSDYDAFNLPGYLRNALTSLKTVSTPSEFDINCLEEQIDKILMLSDEIAMEAGEIDYVVSTFEHTVAVAGALRDKWGLKGTSREVATKLRDKVCMRSALLGNEIVAMPGFIETSRPSRDEVVQFLENYGKIIIKPKSQAGAKDVAIVDSKAAIEKYEEEFGLIDVCIEEYVDEEIYHFDGLVVDGVVKFLSVGRYFGTCYKYVHEKQPMGTVLVTETAVIEQAHQFTVELLCQLGYIRGAFHIEAFRRGDGFLLLEIAGRIPGAGFTDHIKEYFDVDMIGSSYEVDLGKNPCLKSRGSIEGQPSSSRGLVMFPPPVNRLMRVDAIEGLQVKRPYLVDTRLSGPGSVIKSTPFEAFKPIATFSVEARTEHDVIECLTDIIRSVNVKYSPL